MTEYLYLGYKELRENRRSDVTMRGFKYKQMQIECAGYSMIDWCHWMGAKRLAEMSDIHL